MEINGIYVIETDCMLPIDSLTPYSKNAKKHPKEQIEEIKASIRHFGMDDPIGVWGDKNLIVEGHGRLIACKELGIDTVPCIRLDHLTAEQRKAYTIAHNKTNMDSGFDMDILASELSEITDIDMSDFGDFGIENVADPDGTYTTKINIPQYEITGEQPSISDMLDTEKADGFIAEIEAAEGITDEEKAFLIQASRRHNVFNYRNIAEYYAHATPEMQRLMEKNALVIIDVDDAIANGYARLSGDIMAMLEDDDDA